MGERRKDAIEDNGSVHGHQWTRREPVVVPWPENTVPVTDQPVVSPALVGHIRDRDALLVAIREMKRATARFKAAMRSFMQEFIDRMADAEEEDWDVEECGADEREAEGG